MWLNPEVDISLFATTANPQQLYHSPRVKILAFRVSSGKVSAGVWWVQFPVETAKERVTVQSAEHHCTKKLFPSGNHHTSHF